MIIADTNILLRAVLDDDFRQSEIARKYLEEAEEVAFSLYAICEFVWVLSRRYKIDNAEIVASLNHLIHDNRVYCDRDAIEAGLSFLEAGGDFADGVIEYEGRRLGGTKFITFDKRAAAVIRSQRRECLLLDTE